MKTFRCACGNLLFFENSRCLNCGRTLGYVPECRILGPIEHIDDKSYRVLASETVQGMYRKCVHFEREEVCNWLVPEEEPQSFCRACRLNEIIPNLSKPENRFYWYRLELSKRRLLYTLDALHLPVEGRDKNSERGLAFAFLEDPPTYDEMGRVFTGHEAGLITINVAEADDVEREKMRQEMNEPYRTLLGHFRHESGHYYWERLIHGSAWLDEFRSLFGDEQAIYDDCLAAYYRNGPPQGWQEQYISAYAASHPWEDWAETWAHYLHMVDALETANDFGMVGKLQILEEPCRESGGVDFYASGTDFDSLLERWYRLGVAMNSISRSIGQKDFYPFVLGETAVAKLRFVHRVIRGRLSSDLPG